MPIRIFKPGRSTWNFPIPHVFWSLVGYTVLWLFISAFPAHSAEYPKTFAYVSAQNIITAEVAGDHTFVVNFINLSDFVNVIQPADFIYRGASGRYYIGQVYELKHQDSLGNAQKYSASILVRGHSFEGMNIDGQFREKDAIEELSVRIGSHRFYLQGLDKIRFEELVRKVEELDLYSTNVPAMLRELNIRETGYETSTDGTDEWDKDWEGLLTEDGINPSRAIETPPISFPEDASKYKGNEMVRLSCVVNKSGGLLNLKVVKGINRKLDQRALDGVANSWVFLPATKNGEVVESLIELNVTFAPPIENP